MFSLIRKRLINSIRCRPLLNLTKYVEEPFHSIVRDKSDSNKTEQFENFKSNGLEVKHTEESCIVKIPVGKCSGHEVSAEFENNNLVIKGKVVKHNDERNDHKIKHYTHKIKLEKNYAKHAIETKMEDRNFIVIIPTEGKNETTKP